MRREGRIGFSLAVASSLHFITEAGARNLVLHVTTRASGRKAKCAGMVLLSWSYCFFPFTLRWNSHSPSDSGANSEVRTKGRNRLHRVSHPLFAVQVAVLFVRDSESCRRNPSHSVLRAISNGIDSLLQPLHVQLLRFPSRRDDELSEATSPESRTISRHDVIPSFPW